mmetsp:Transcript_44755/g.140340  ORF Transcript_44755/g.140340 Transcript_44755/m.140340 type:complete len:255 (-) Transcript_44755:2262-3026(-)
MLTTRSSMLESSRHRSCLRSSSSNSSCGRNCGLELASRPSLSFVAMLVTRCARCSTPARTSSMTPSARQTLRWVWASRISSRFNSFSNLRTSCVSRSSSASAPPLSLSSSSSSWIVACSALSSLVRASNWCCWSFRSSMSFRFIVYFSMSSSLLFVPTRSSRYWRASCMRCSGGPSLVMACEGTMAAQLERRPRESGGCDASGVVGRGDVAEDSSFEPTERLVGGSEFTGVSSSPEAVLPPPKSFMQELATPAG